MLTHGNWTESVVYAFNRDGSRGYSPRGGAALGSDGNLYGTTLHGGTQPPAGVVFELSPVGSGWSETVLHNFQGGDDGTSPDAGVILDRVGNIYGTTSGLGSTNGGTVFELSPSAAGWTLNTLCIFSGGFAAEGPAGNLVMDAAGNLYGTTVSDGMYGQGTVFKASQAGGVWTCATLHDFTGGADGGAPLDGLAMDASGNLYGTTYQGGTGSACPRGCGVAFVVATN
jgi:uncharacterized repeat protein (TIGR03803 family)